MQDNIFLEHLDSRILAMRSMFGWKTYPSILNSLKNKVLEFSSTT